MQAQVFVPGPVLVQVALEEQPPLFVRHELMAVHVMPVPENPLLHAQLLVPGPVIVQVALAAQPPLPVRHELTGVQTVPLPKIEAKGGLDKN